MLKSEGKPWIVLEANHAIIINTDASYNYTRQRTVYYTIPIPQMTKGNNLNRTLNVYL